MARNTYMDIFTEDEKMNVKVKMKSDATNGNYPILDIQTESKTIRMFTTMEQIKQLQQALNEFVGKNTQKYLRCINDTPCFTTGKDYLIHNEEKGIYEVKDNDGDLRYMELLFWTDNFTLIEK